VFIVGRNATAMNMASVEIIGLVQIVGTAIVFVQNFELVNPNFKSVLEIRFSTIQQSLS